MENQIHYDKDQCGTIGFPIITAKQAREMYDNSWLLQYKQICEYITAEASRSFNHLHVNNIHPMTLKKLIDDGFVVEKAVDAYSKISW